MGIKKKILKNSLHSIISIYIAIAFTAIVTILVTNMSFIYKLAINKLELSKISGVNNENIMSSYKAIIRYLQNPFIKNLELNHFNISKYGYIHFYEVKKIFIGLIIIAAIFIFSLLLVVFLTYKYKKINKKSILRVFNRSFNILITFIVTIFVAINLDFSKAFEMFHKIFFRNNYWVFDPKTDPIIKVLPEEVFFTYGVIILLIISVTSIVGKIFCKKNMTI